MVDDPMAARLDAELVRRGLFATRSRAQAAIRAGCVRVNGVVEERASHRVGRDELIDAEDVHPFVSRGGLKLDHALAVFGIDVRGLICLDIGASTGGFTDVLLRRGAARVTAVDVGRDQLHASIRNDPRVVSLEGVDARRLTARDVGAPPSLIVCDASFIGLEKVLARPLRLAAPAARLIALFKPQFEVGPQAVGRGGIVRDAEAVLAAEDRVSAWLVSEGWPVTASIDSPILGGDGNAERLLLASSGDGAPS